MHLGQSLPIDHQQKQELQREDQQPAAQFHLGMGAAGLLDCQASRCGRVGVWVRTVDACMSPCPGPQLHCCSGTWQAPRGENLQPPMTYYYLQLSPLACMHLRMTL